MRILWQDLRYGVRMLWKNRGVTVVAIIALALGVGANTAIFSVINAVLLRPLPYTEPERIVTLWSNDSRQGQERGSVAAPDFADWQRQNGVFERIAAYHYASFTLTGGDAPERLAGAFATADFSQVMKVEPALGRSFLAEEDRPGGARVVIVSHDLWQRRFAADPQVINRVVTINGESFTVVGVMPPGFRFPGACDVWTPAALNDVRQPGQVNSFLSVIARLKPDATLAEAQTEMRVISERLAQAHPDTNRFRTGEVVSLHEVIVGSVRPSLIALYGAVCLVLLIACANVANLLLARTAARRKEIAVRTALGASRFRLITQLLTESVLLAIVGGACGLLLAVWGTDLLVSLFQGSVPRMRDVAVDSQALAFTALVSLLTGLVFGLAPAIQASKIDLSSSLKEGSRSQTTSFRRQRFRSLMVVAQIAFALILLVGAGLFIQSFQRLRGTNAGFDPENVLTLQVSLPRARYGEANQQIAFFRQTLERLAAVPGVRAVGVVTNLPFGSSLTSNSFDIAGRPATSPDEGRNAARSTISPDYFRAMSIPVIAGRVFTERDTRDAPGVVIINRALARRYFADVDPIGQRISIGGSDEIAMYGEPVSREIVGVVGDVRFELENEASPEMYVPYQQRPTSSMVIVARTDVTSSSVIPAMRAGVQEIDRDQTIYNVRTMEQRLTEQVASQRLMMFLTGLFAGLALLLAAVGIYGVVSYSVTQRTQEIGIRIALGAQRRDVLRLVVGQGVILATLGIIIGLIGALAVTRVMQSLLYDVSATDPLTFASVSILLSGVAFLASYIPARRATKVDPMVALRYE